MRKFLIPFLPFLIILPAVFILSKITPQRTVEGVVSTQPSKIHYEGCGKAACSPYDGYIFTLKGSNDTFECFADCSSFVGNEKVRLTVKDNFFGFVSQAPLTVLSAEIIR